MADQDLNIHIKAQDETAGTAKSLQSVAGNIAAGFEGAGRQMRMMGREIGQIGSAMVMAGTAITAPMLLAYKTAANYSPQIKQQIDDMAEQWDKMAISVGQSMLPVMQNLTQVIQSLTDKWMSLSQATRDHITQTTLLTGGYLLFGGIGVKALGEVLRVGGDVLMLTGKMFQGIQALTGAFRVVSIAIAGMSAPMWLVVAGVAAIVAAVAMIPDGWKYVLDAVQKVWDVVKGVVYEIATLNDKLIGSKRAAQDWAEATAAMQDAVSFKSGQHGDFANGVQDIVVKIQGVIDTAKQGASTVTDAFNIMTNGAKGFDSQINQDKNDTNTFFNGFLQAVQTAKGSWNTWQTAGETAGKGVFSDLQSSLSGFFDNVFTGQLTKASQLFANFGNSLLKTFSNVISQMITQWIASKLWSLLSGGLGGLPGGLAGITSSSSLSAGGAFAAAPLMHDGGPVGSSWANPVVAHDGLAVDEVPAVLQTGEGVLSRDGMSNLAKLNNGQGGQGGGMTVNPTIVIQAWDATDVMRNMSAIQNSIVQNIMNNGQIRTMMRQYA